MDDVTIVQADVLEGVDAVEDSSIQCVMTSPPYYQLRDYEVDGQLGQEGRFDCMGWAPGGERCGECYVCRLTLAMREVRRTLRDDGTLWLNIGDAYARRRSRGVKHDGGNTGYGDRQADEGMKDAGVPANLKEKDLLGTPWRVAMALQYDGWWLRQEITWVKGLSHLDEWAGSCMPESVTERSTCATEKVFQLAPSKNYFYDHEGAKESGRNRDPRNADEHKHHQLDSTKTNNLHKVGPVKKRNYRNAWAITPGSYSGAHFAVFPEELVAACLDGGVSDGGRCPECGTPMERVVDREAIDLRPEDEDRTEKVEQSHGRDGRTGRRRINKSGTLGYEPGCDCDVDAGDAEPCRVMDPFMGSGTVGVVCATRGYDFVGVDLRGEYCEMARERIAERKAELGELDAGTAEDLDMTGQMGLLG